jgi:hypothetical protein
MTSTATLIVDIPKLQSTITGFLEGPLPKQNLVPAPPLVSVKQMPLLDQKSERCNRMVDVMEETDNFANFLVCWAKI